MFLGAKDCFYIKDIHQRPIVSLVVDHDHKDNTLRGVLCSECNLGLGKFQDNSVLLQRAVKYLESQGSER